MWHALGDKQNTNSALVRKYEGRGLFGRPWCKWKGNIKMDLKKVKLVGAD